MTRLELTDEQADALSDLLHNTIADLGMEIAATERLEFREQVKHRRHVLDQIYRALRSAKPQTA